VNELLHFSGCKFKTFLPMAKGFQKNYTLNLLLIFLPEADPFAATFF